MARVVGKNLQISSKKAYEVANFIRGKKADSVLRDLQLVIEKKKAVPYRRYHMNVSPKRGIGPGKYPVNVSFEIIKLIDSLKANAKEKGLDEKNLVLLHAAAHQGPKIRHNGRQGGTRKNAHFELVAKEIEKETKQVSKKVQSETTKVSTGVKSQ